MKDGILGFALEVLLEELGCTIIDNGETVSIQYMSKHLNLEKRDDHWYDLEKNLTFHSRPQIIFYLVGN